MKRARASSGGVWGRLAWTLLAATVTAGVLWWLLSEAVIKALVSALEQAGIGRLAFALLLVPLIQALRAWRFSLLLTGRAEPPSGAMFAIAARLILFNFLLPFKLGELSFPVMMKRAFGTGYLRAAGILVLARAMDLCAVAAILMLGAGLLTDRTAFGWSRPVLLAGGLIALVLPLIVVRLPALVAVPARRLPRLSALMDRLASGMAMVRPLPKSLIALVLTALTWLTHSAVAYLAASAVAPGLPLLPVVLAGAASNLAFALPVSGIAGLGPPQAAWATVLNWTGAGWEVAIVSALVCHGVLLIGVVLTGVATMLGPARPDALRAAPHP